MNARLLLPPFLFLFLLAFSPSQSSFIFTIIIRGAGSVNSIYFQHTVPRHAVRPYEPYNIQPEWLADTDSRFVAYPCPHSAETNKHVKACDKVYTGKAHERALPRHAVQMEVEEQTPPQGGDGRMEE